VPKIVCFICFDKWSAIEAVGSLPHIALPSVRTFVCRMSAVVPVLLPVNLYVYSVKNNKNGGFVCGLVDHDTGWSGTVRVSTVPPRISQHGYYLPPSRSLSHCLLAYHDRLIADHCPYATNVCQWVLNSIFKWSKV